MIVTISLQVNKSTMLKLTEVNAKIKGWDEEYAEKMTTRSCTLELQHHLKLINENIGRYNQTKDVSIFQNYLQVLNNTDFSSQKNKSQDVRGTKQVPPNTDLHVLQPQENVETARKSKRCPLKDTTQSINNIINKKIKVSKIIKKEKMSMDIIHPVKTVIDNIKTEQQEMPPPSIPPTKKNRKKKESEVKVKRESARTKNVSKITLNEENEYGRPSDVILNPLEIITVVLDDDSGQNVEQMPLRMTRSKVNKKNVIPVSLHSRKVSSSKHTIYKGPPSEIIEASIYEDAEASVESVVGNCKLPINLISEKNNIKINENKMQLTGAKAILDQVTANGSQKSVSTTNETFVTTTNETFVRNAKDLLTESSIDAVVTKMLNETIVLSKHSQDIANETRIILKDNGDIINETMVISTKNVKDNGSNFEVNLKDIMTDDDTLDDSTLEAKNEAIKESNLIFNPFEYSPIKKRVEAFEKLVTHVAVATSRASRTKTRNENKAKEQPDSKEKYDKEVPSKIPKSTDRKNSTNTTPLSSNKYLPSMSSSKVCRTNSASSVITSKTLTALKASQQEYRQREECRKKKEAEAAKKKEALLKAQIEEKRRKREEKELKAKQQRDALEREKQQLLDLQKLKEEKLKQFMLEKQEKLQVQREEAEKKRLLAKQRSDDKRKEEEYKRMEDEKQQRKLDSLLAQMSPSVKHIPIYRAQKAPLLPTYDCYDSGDDSAPTDGSNKPPKWTRTQAMDSTTRIMQYMDVKFKNTLFCLKPDTPDLLEIFETISPKKLKRNSSAVWTHQPRFTLMPSLNEDMIL